MISHFELKFIVAVYDARWYLAVTKKVHVVGNIDLYYALNDGISTLAFAFSAGLLSLFKRDAAETYIMVHGS